jgi:hypothetical protein
MTCYGDTPPPHDTAKEIDWDIRYGVTEPRSLRTTTTGSWATRIS